MQRIVTDVIQPEPDSDPGGVVQAHALRATAFDRLDGQLAGRACAGAEASDRAAAPSLFYADRAHPIPEELAPPQARSARLPARRSIARAIDEARPYRSLFPPGAPDRD